MFKTTRSRVIGLVVALVAMALIVLIVTQVIIPGSTTPVSTGQPQAATIDLSKFGKKPTQTQSAAAPKSGLSPVLYLQPLAPVARPAMQQAFIPCSQQRGSTATPTSAAASIATAASTPSADATLSATSEVTAAATQSAALAPDPIVLQIAPKESEACYQVGEIFINRDNAFNLAIGISTAIDGQIAIDRNNVANSQLGQIVVDISQLTSDSGQRDGQIRRRWLESNKYPLAKFTPTELIGLPERPYKDGETLSFRVNGNMLIRDVEKPLVFNVTASLKGDTLIGTATTDFKMTYFGFDAPDIGGMLKANDDVHVILNFIAHEKK